MVNVKASKSNSISLYLYDVTPRFFSGLVMSSTLISEYPTILITSFLLRHFSKFARCSTTVPRLNLTSLQHNKRPKIRRPFFILYDTSKEQEIIFLPLHSLCLDLSSVIMHYLLDHLNYSAHHELP